ncbi:MAG: glycine cleavage system aminomethyltransferase GcvT [Vallitaleaceae bacterium]|nr:glycine cleavage system aminomethyltransferase GcvT [Vallitaleaceae bacterium]
MSKLKKTPLYETHIKYGGKMVAFAGYLLPIQYKGIMEEHEAVRKRVGVFDVSHMGEIRISGTDAKDCVNYLITNDVSEMKKGQIKYSPMCYENGGTVDDILVYCYSEENYLLVVNAANIEKDEEHIRRNSKGYDVEIHNLSDDYGQIAVQGPAALEIALQLCEEDLSLMKYYSFAESVEVGGVDCIVSRTGYTGEDGFEFYMKAQDAPRLWEKIMEVGQNYGIEAAGLGCRDTLRFEAGMPLYGNELSASISPLEAGLGIFVKGKKAAIKNEEAFLGQKALVQQKEEGLSRKLVGFQLKEKGIARSAYPVFNQLGEEIGSVTSGYQSPSLEIAIGFALIRYEEAELGNSIWIAIRNRKVEAEIVDRRFLKR